MCGRACAIPDPFKPSTASIAAIIIIAAVVAAAAIGAWVWSLYAMKAAARRSLKLLADEHARKVHSSLMEYLCTELRNPVRCVQPFDTRWDVLACGRWWLCMMSAAPHCDPTWCFRLRYRDRRCRYEPPHLGSRRHAL